MPCANRSAEWGWTVPAPSPALARAFLSERYGYLAGFASPIPHSITGPETKLAALSSGTPCVVPDGAAADSAAGSGGAGGPGVRLVGFKPGLGPEAAIAEEAEYPLVEPVE